ncbi:hypothetical protein [Deinococcus aquaedulcis]|uniref:hypothetical protein n=1 Tax=Deinococcus aquaedulcis TaxID=2840455 RepID=UPI001C836F7F|nr:hypothetical protein [Deinococcus aquaedulcis]
MQLLTQQPTITVDAATGGYYFKGPITFGSAQKLKATVPPGSSLLFQSTGGRSEEAREIARWIKSNGIELTIKGYCVSACANYIAAVPHVQWNQPVLLLFHGGGLQTYVQPCAQLAPCGAPGPTGATVTDFDREFGLNSNFVTFSGRAADEVLRRRGATDGATRLPGLPSPYFWAPTAEELACFGIAAQVSSVVDFPVSPAAKKWWFTTASLSSELQAELRAICQEVKPAVAHAAGQPL